MKAQIKRNALVLTLVAAVVAPTLMSSPANALDRRSFNYWEQSGFTRSQTYVVKHRSCCGGTYYKRYAVPVVVAACTTSTTIQPLPTYVCCQQRGKHGVAWRNHWVSGSCAAASPYAYYSKGCTMDSPVHDTGVPILQRGQCQFSTIAKYSSYYGYYK